MPSSKSFLTYILDQLSDVPGVSFRPMMGEYLLYVGGKLVGGIYDDRLLLKPLPAVRALSPDAPEEKPYDGAGDMLLIEDTDDREILASLVTAAAEALPPPKPKAKSASKAKAARRSAGKAGKDANDGIDGTNGTE